MELFLIISLIVINKTFDTICDTTYNKDRRYLRCQSGINY